MKIANSWVVRFVSSLCEDLDRNLLCWELAWNRIRQDISKARYIYGVRRHVKLLSSRPGGFWHMPIGSGRNIGKRLAKHGALGSRYELD